MGFLLEFKYLDNTRHRNKIEWQRKYRNKNRIKCRTLNRIRSAEYRKEHPDIIKAIKKREYAKHRVQIKERVRLWRINNPEKYREQLKKAKNKRKIEHNEYKNKRRCIGCTSILKEHNRIVCDWCLLSYPQKYEVIEQKGSL